MHSAAEHDYHKGKINKKMSLMNAKSPVRTQTLEVNKGAFLFI
jgi:hypothetical protein